MARQKLKVLLCTDFQGKSTNARRDYLFGFNRFSRHEMFYLSDWRSNHCRRFLELDLDAFDVILFPWDCYWLDIDKPWTRYYTPQIAIDRIAGSSALKVQFLQDEYRDVREINRALARVGINVMFTCVAEQDHDLFYPRSLIPSLAATHTVLTGYVPAYLERIARSRFETRCVDIGYRAQILPYYYGSLAREKAQIAIEFTRIGSQYGFSTDISLRLQDRIFGERWLEFLRSSRFALGTESGASVVDFDGQIRAKCERYVKEHPEASFEEIKRLFFADVDGKVVVQTISPRIFESAAFGNTLILHEGKYAGLLKPDVHFISVNKDYSNVQEVVERMRDRAFCDQLAANAKADLIHSGNFSYRSFVKRIDDILSDHRPEPSRNDKAPARVSFYARNYLNRHGVVPRGGSFTHFAHPIDLVERGVNGGRDLSWLVPTVRHVLNLLVSCDRLRTRLIDAILHRDRNPIPSLGGLFKDFRMLALLNLSRHQQQIRGATFEIRAECDPAGRLVFRSIPGADAQPNGADTSAQRRKQDEEIAGRLRQADRLAFLSWDHSKVGPSFIFPIGKHRFFLICLQEEDTYHFRNFPGLFENRGREGLEVLQEILLKPIQHQSAWRKGLVLFQLACAATYSLHEKALVAIKTVLGRCLSRLPLGHPNGKNGQDQKAMSWRTVMGRPSVVGQVDRNQDQEAR